MPDISWLFILVFNAVVHEDPNLCLLSSSFSLGVKKKRKEKKRKQEMQREEPGPTEPTFAQLLCTSNRKCTKKKGKACV